MIRKNHSAVWGYQLRLKDEQKRHLIFWFFHN